MLNKSNKPYIRNEVDNQIKKYINSIKQKENWIWYNYKSNNGYGTKKDNHSLYYYEHDYRVEFKMIKEKERLTLDKKERITLKDYITIFSYNAGIDFFLSYSIVKTNLPNIPNLKFEDLFENSYSTKETNIITISLSNIIKLNNRTNIRLLKRIHKILMEIDTNILTTQGLQRIACKPSII